MPCRSMQRICCFITCPPFSVFEVFHSPRIHTASSKLSRLLGLKSKSQNPFDILGLSRASKQVRPGTTHNPSAGLCSTIMYHPCTIPHYPTTPSASQFKASAGPGRSTTCLSQAGGQIASRHRRDWRCCCLPPSPVGCFDMFSFRTKP